MRPIRRLDHVAVAVSSTEDALCYFRDTLGLAVVRSEELVDPHVRLTYLDAGNAYVQLVEPLDSTLELAQWIAENGEGLHHLCFGVDDVPAAAAGLAAAGAPDVSLASGRGRVSAFVPGPTSHGVRVECTEFRVDEDVETVAGWLPPAGS